MGYAVLHLEKAKGADGAMSTHIERTVHPKNADRMHQTQGGHQPGKGNPGAAHRKQRGHEAYGRGREA